jgi:hypothetical protein
MSSPLHAADLLAQQARVPVAVTKERDPGWGHCRGLSSNRRRSFLPNRRSNGTKEGLVRLSQIGKEDEMRQAIAVLTVSVVSAFAVPSVPARAQTTLWCDPWVRCVRTTQQGYNACYELAMKRGWNMQRTDYIGRNEFIYKCLRGGIPR